MKIHHSFFNWFFCLAFSTSWVASQTFPVSKQKLVEKNGTAQKKKLNRSGAQKVALSTAARKAIIDQLEKNMVFVDKGAFTMGSTPKQGNWKADKKPAHEVILSSFSIGKFEVTQQEWEAVMETNPSEFSGYPRCPVERVSWEECQAFLKKLNQMTGKRYRLPTEAEWEYAARGGKKSRGFKYSGSNNLAKVAWFCDNSLSKTHPVGMKQQNELGLFDMSGNVWEWCNDKFCSKYPNAQGMLNPQGPSSGKYRVFRGGSWLHNSDLGLVSYRAGYFPNESGYNIGFRLVLPYQNTR